LPEHIDEAVFAPPRIGIVQAQVIQLRSRPCCYDDAVAAYRAGRFDLCLRQLGDDGTSTSRALRARALTRAGKVEAALEACGVVEDGLSCVQRAELDILRAHAMLRLGRLEGAESHLLSARVWADASSSRPLEADVEFTDAVLHFSARDFEQAVESLERSLGVGEPLGAPWRPQEPAYFLSWGVVRSRVLDLGGVLARNKERLAGQLHWARRALSELDACPGEDEWLKATLLSNFAAIAMEIGDPALLAEIRQRAEQIAWSDSMALQRFNVVRFLGWLHALAGDHVGAFREFRRSSDLAPTRPWKIESVLQSCFLARELGQRLIGDGELDYAIDLAGSLETSTSTPAPAFSALLKLAELAAKRSAEEGRALLVRYRAARAKCSPALFNGGDLDWQAKELVAEAMVARAEGRDDAAEDLLINAFDAYDRLGSRWRAALVAIELLEITEQPFFEGYARREAGMRPNSWLARRLAVVERTGGANRDA
jgi:tetratricopeptide (TPR) repeat protein